MEMVMCRTLWGGGGDRKAGEKERATQPGVGNPPSGRATVRAGLSRLEMLIP